MTMKLPRPASSQAADLVNPRSKELLWQGNQIRGAGIWGEFDAQGFGSSRAPFKEDASGSTFHWDEKKTQIATVESHLRKKQS